MDQQIDDTIQRVAGEMPAQFENYISQGLLRYMLHVIPCEKIQFSGLKMANFSSWALPRTPPGGQPPVPRPPMSLYSFPPSHRPSHLPLAGAMPFYALKQGVQS